MIKNNRIPPRLLVSDRQGHVTEIPELAVLAWTAAGECSPGPGEWVPLPEGSELMELPGRLPVGLAADDSRVVLSEYGGRPVWAVAAFLAPAHTATFLANWETAPNAPILPLFAYAAAGWDGRRFVTTGLRVDPDPRQECAGFDDAAIQTNALRLRERFPANRIIAHVVDSCALNYRCPAARNFVLGRHEAPLPTSPVCNAQCQGCISLQEGTGVPVTQPRLQFVPTPEELVELALEHFAAVPEGVVSFGQGCEGEPLMVAEVLEEAVRRIRRVTPRGTINLNSNASRPEAVERLFNAGLDSIRVSLNSAQERCYLAYYNPLDYGFEDVRESLRVARRLGKVASVNYFVLPGFTDSADEIAAFLRLLGETRPNYIQSRNLNIDPRWYVAHLGLDAAALRPVGIRAWMDEVRRAFPWMLFRYFNMRREDAPERGKNL